MFGIIFYSVCMLGAGRWKEVSPIIYALAVISILYLVVVVASL